MSYEPKNYDHLLGTAGFSDQLLKNHFTLYQGYVANTNKLLEELSELTASGKTGTPAYAELKRRFGWEFNGMRLHELYFGNMTKGGGTADQSSDFYKRLVEDFGSYENWEKDFKGTGTMRGIGWTILYYDSEANRMFNVWVNEHDFGHLVGAKPLLILDVFEHAYMLDYGLKKTDYIEAFFKAIDWKVTMERFR
ncbi:MAG: superoxide dismutase [Candidatus Sungiibacteriota bacterium]|uniref:superoxide dismutase n=1 Tax=Candidatus Sungiibacteriota bacterium TaxID=2750080 RepID=A0A7T5RJY8_9BACT|nr:MAG: superoxide dismutase [Candidatus Sungbacteria bacterium]